MTKYVAFLRAINVGGTKIVKMDELRKMFDSFGFGNVQTYIQSGNVIFETKAFPTLEAKIEKQLEEIWGQKTGVFLRAMEEIERIANQSHLKSKEDEPLDEGLLREK